MSPSVAASHLLHPRRPAPQHGLSPALADPVYLSPGVLTGVLLLVEGEGLLVFARFWDANAPTMASSKLPVF